MNEVKICANQRGGYYVLCASVGQPWAAELNAKPDGEGVERAWLRVRHARPEEAKAVAIEAPQCWAVIIPDGEDRVIEVGGCKNEDGNASRHYFMLEGGRWRRVSRETALNARWVPQELSAVELSDDENIPF